MDPKIIKKVGNDVDPLTQTLIDFQKSEPMRYSELFAATARRFASMNGAAPSSKVNKSGYLRYVDGLSKEFNNIVGQFTGADGKVDMSKVNEMTKKYGVARHSKPEDLRKSLFAIQRQFDVNKKYFDKGLTPSRNQLKEDSRYLGDGFNVLGTDAMYDHQGGRNFIKKVEDEARSDFRAKGGTIPKAQSKINRIR